MRKQWIVNGLVVLMATYLVFPYGQRAVLAAFNAPPQTWSTTYEADPTATDPVSQGDDHLRAVKTEIRRRAAVEHDWGNIAASTNDTGRHFPGSGRVFSQNTAPTVDGTSGASCLFKADLNAGQACDGGRLWVDKDGPDNVAANTDDNTLYACDDTDGDGDCDAWDAITTVAAVPQNAIIIWDQSNTCPTGYTEATEFRDQTIRGADRAGIDANIPDSAGVLCNAAVVSAGCGAAGGAENYNDTISIGELPAHTHTINATNQLLSGGGVGITSGDAGTTTETASTGGAQNSYPPLRTVLFCRKS